jgi:hypothetical protein
MSAQHQWNQLPHTPASLTSEADPILERITDALERRLTRHDTKILSPVCQ